jgi:hypothetical protein
MDDRIYTSRPINKQAAVVTSAQNSNDHVNFTTRVIRSRTPLPTEHALVRSQDKIIGERFGGFTVIGAFPLINRNKNRQWVVRCDCGWYETRRLKSLRTVNPNSLCCMECQAVKKLSNKTMSQSLGGTLLKNDDENGYFKTDNSFKKSYNVGDVAINKDGVEDFVVFVSNKRIKFGFNKFKNGDIITNQSR